MEGFRFTKTLSRQGRKRGTLISGLIRGTSKGRKYNSG